MEDSEDELDRDLTRELGNIVYRMHQLEQRRDEILEELGVSPRDQ